MEWKVVWIVEDVGILGDMVLGGMRLFVFVIFLFSERRGKVISFKCIDDLRKKKKV